MRLVQKRQIGFNILGRIIISYIIFILLTLLLNKNNNDRLSSFIFVNIAALIALVVLCYKLNNQVGFKVLRIIFVGYFIKLFIGFLFWEFYMFPDYFSNALSIFKFDHYEYLITESWMRDFAEQRLINGFFYLPPQLLLLVDHFSLHFLMSNLYLSESYNPFDLAVQNNLFSMYTAVIVLAISKYLGATTKQMKFSLILGIYQPFSMISSIIWRDVVGQFFVALGGYLTLKSLNKNILIAMLLLLAASLSMIIQRNLYFFFPTLAYMAYVVIKSKNKYQLLIIPIIIGAIIFLNSHFSLTDKLNLSYGSNLTSISLWLFLPINIIRIFIGPFPWVNWFEFNDNSIFQIADYFQSITTISLVILCYIAIFKKKLLSLQSSNSNVLMLVLLFILFVFAGLGTVEVHQSYMSTGAIFLIPPVILTSNKKKYLKLFFYVLYFFICANILFVLLGFHGSGIGTSFR